MADIGEFIRQREKQGLLRTLKPSAWRLEGKISFNNKEYVDFSSNDYLGLSAHPKLKEASRQALDKFGTSASASRLLSGDSDLYHRLEEDVARFKNKEAALVFNSGYQANLGIISALYARGDCIFSDRLNHASIVDGIILSRATLFRFRHNDTEHLKALLEKERPKFHNALIVTESVFSMDGDRAPLKEMVGLKLKYNCRILIDEAHATGIFGRTGSGMAEEEGVSEETDLIMGTFSKALGSFGAYLATSKQIADYLVNTARSFIYSSALPPAVIACNLASLEIIRDEPQRRERLLALAGFLRDKLKKSRFSLKGSSHIVPVILGDNFKAVEYARQLQEKGYWVPPIRPPAVPAQEARLRFSLSFYHDRDTLNELSHELDGIRI